MSMKTAYLKNNANQFSHAFIPINFIDSCTDKHKQHVDHITRCALRGSAKQCAGSAWVASEARQMQYITTSKPLTLKQLYFYSLISDCETNTPDKFGYIPPASGRPATCYCARAHHRCPLDGAHHSDPYWLSTGYLCGSGLHTRSRCFNWIQLTSWTSVFQLTLSHHGPFCCPRRPVCAAEVDQENRTFHNSGPATTQQSATSPPKHYRGASDWVAFCSLSIHWMYSVSVCLKLCINCYWHLRHLTIKFKSIFKFVCIADDIKQAKFRRSFEKTNEFYYNIILR